MSGRGPGEWDMELTASAEHRQGWETWQRCPREWSAECDRECLEQRVCHSLASLGKSIPALLCFYWIYSPLNHFWKCRIKTNLRAVGKMKQNSLRLKQLAQAHLLASGILTWKSTCHFWLGLCQDPRTNCEVLNPAEVPLMPELSWAGSCWSSSICFPQGIVFISLLSLKRRNLICFPPYSVLSNVSFSSKFQYIIPDLDLPKLCTQNRLDWKLELNKL